MRRRLSLLAMIFALVAQAVPASAVQYGVKDTNDVYDGVGLVLFYDGASGGEFPGFGNPIWRCTGALISESEFLTAGHCTEDFTAARAAIWFDVDVILDTEAPIEGYPNPASADATGTPDSHPSWTGALTIPNTSDVGLVHLDEDVTGRDIYPVAPVGYLDGLATRQGVQDVSLTVVGYGLQMVRPFFKGERSRYIGEVRIHDLRSALTDGYNVGYTSNPGRAWTGGTCFGDSGGPVFHDGKIVAVNSFVLNSNCKGSGYAYRVDTGYAQAFIFPS